MRTMELAQVQENGQITIPDEVRRKLGVKEGDMVAFIETDDGVLISTREAAAMMALDQIGAMLREKGITLEEMMETGREIRGDLLKEMYGIDPDSFRRR